MGSSALQPNTQNTFQEFAAANADLSTSMHATYMIRRFRSMGILAETVQRDGVFSHIHIPANDDSYLEIYPNPINEDGVISTEPFMTWNQFPKALAERLKKARKATGYYSYNAQFILYVDDHDPEFPDRQTIGSESGPAELARFAFAAGDFQKFIFGAIFKMKEETGFEVYPAIRRSQVAL